MHSIARPDTPTDYEPIDPELTIDNRTLSIALACVEAAGAFLTAAQQRADRLQRLHDHAPNPTPLTAPLAQSYKAVDAAHDKHVADGIFLHRLMLLSGNEELRRRAVEWFLGAHGLHSVPFPPEFPADQRPRRLPSDLFARISRPWYQR